MPAFDVPANLAFDTYDELKTAIADWMDRDDLSGSIEAMIALAEARMNRELGDFLPEQTATITVTGGIGALPIDFGTAVRLTDSFGALNQRGRTAVPSGFAYRIEANRIVVSPAENYTLTMLYTPRIAPLSETNPNTTLLSQNPDLYFYGTMMFAEGFVANDPRAALFKGLWDESLDSAKRHYLAKRYGGPLAPRMQVT